MPKKKTGVLICANDQECFWTTNGQIIRDLNELQAALAEMEESVFNFHTRGKENDFARWVEEVLNDYECAMDLRRADKPLQARTVVVHHLRAYNL